MKKNGSPMSWLIEHRLNKDIWLSISYHEIQQSQMERGKEQEKRPENSDNR